MKGRFGEQEALIEKYDHTAVKWKVAVERVQPGSGTTFYLHFKPTNPNLYYQLCTIAVFDESNRTRLYQLRVGDVVMVEGVLKALSSKSNFVIEATGYELMEAAPGG